MKAFGLYTLARLGLFTLVYGLIWLIFGQWLDWNAVSALYTAFIAMAISAIVSAFALAGLRARLAGEVATRAERAKRSFESRRAAEDADDGGGDGNDAEPGDRRPPDDAPDRHQPPPGR